MFRFANNFIPLGDTEPTSGTATVSGFNIKTQLSDARRNIGYCPQFDALNPLLTGREHLRFYARLRGLSENAVKKVKNENCTSIKLKPLKCLREEFY